MMTTKPIGLYVHIPFCKRKCNYCDFCSFPVSDIGWREEYLDAVCREINAYRDEKIVVDTIFFGGGTPSLLSPDEFVKITSCIKQSFLLTSEIEFTVEANPGTLNSEILNTFVSCGVNRLSLGLQSVHENEQKILGRIHNFDEFKNSYYLARRCGINNINVDLMYGIPDQTIESFRQTLDEVTVLAPEHISVYGLILEEGTPFYEKRNILALPNEDTECDMYYFAADFLKEKGYQHYEISNYSKKDLQCKHNLKYWRDDEYVGVGLSAYSYFRNKRFGNYRDINEYLSNIGIKYEAEEIIDKASESYEYVMLRLRLAEGFPLKEYSEKFGSSFLLGREKKIKALIDNGLLSISNERIALTERGFYVSNSILTELI